MKPLKIVLSAVFSAILLCPVLNAQGQSSVKDIYEKGKRAYLQKDYDTALKAFEHVAKYYPRDPRVRNYIAKTRMAIKAGKPRATLEAKLRSIIIPNVEFEDADLETVMTYLSQKTAELSGGKVRPNFVFKGTTEEKNAGGINLKLNHVPVSEVIRYVGEMSRTQFRYEQFAITAVPFRMLVPTEQESPAKKSSGDPFDPFA